MKTWEVEKSQEFESLTEFMSRELPRECIDQWKNSILKKKDWFELQKNLNILQLRCSASQHMIKIKISQIMKLDRRFPTLQKWVKSKAWCKRYCTLKFFAHQIQRNEMFSVFAAFQVTLCPISSKMKLKMISPSRSRTQIDAKMIASVPLPLHS